MTISQLAVAVQKPIKNHEFFQINNCHLFTETEGNSVFWGSNTAVVTRSEVKDQSKGHKTHCFPEVSVNKYFIIINI